LLVLENPHARYGNKHIIRRDQRPVISFELENRGQSPQVGVGDVDEVNFRWFLFWGEFDLRGWERG